MAYLIEITKGAQLYQEFNIKDSDGVSTDLANATLSVVADNIIEPMNITATKGAETGQIFLTADAANTLTAESGSYPLQVWASWSVGNPTDEPLFEVKLVIKDRPA